MSAARLVRAVGRRSAWLIAMLLSALAVLGGFGPIERMGLLAYDAIEPLARPRGTPAQTAIVAVDEASVSALGRWPWNRSLHAELLQRLTDAQVAAVGFAILFAEPAPGDARLAAALARSKRAVLAVAPISTSTRPGVQEILPTPELAAQAAALGHVDVELDADALARRTYRRAGSGTPTWQALPLALWEQTRLHLAGTGPDADDAGATLVLATAAWTREGEMLLPHPDATVHIPTYAYFDVLEDPRLAAQLRGKTILVGTTAAGLEAALATPGSAGKAPMPAVEFHARAHEALRNGQVYRTAGLGPTLALTLLFMAVPALLCPPLRVGAALACGALVLAPALASAIVLKLTLVWVSPAAAMFGLATGFLLWFAINLKQTRGSLRRARRDADATLRSITDAVITLDPDTTIVFMNPVAERLLGMPLAAAAGRPLGELLPDYTVEASRVDSMLASCLLHRRPLQLPEPIVWSTRDGGSRALQLTAAPIGDRSEGAVLALNDVTETVAITSRLQHEATHDPLTGLPNRTLLRDRLCVALTQAERTGRMVALLFVDLDRFKRINDSLGHHCGDHVLKIVAERLNAAVRAGDTVSRWGGDEFIILMDDLNDRSAVITIAQKVLELLDREVDTEDGSRLLLTCSIGISVGPADSMDADTLLSMADKAMYRGKIEGGSSYVFFSTEMNTWSRDRLNMETALRRALKNREFELYYQPQIDIASGRLVGLESLLRWHAPDGGLISPAIFIPAAEESGIIRSIGEWTLHEASAQAARWAHEGLLPVPVAVNVSARQCSDMSLADTIGDALRASALDSALLKIEITETTAMRDVDSVAALLQRVTALGVGVAVDDFGTGYSSLSWLKRFPVSELKIDKSFVDDIAADKDDAAIVRGMIALAHGLGMTVVAEGVETPSQLDFLAAHGCHLAQGYLFARALPAAEVRNWLIAPPAHVLRTALAARPTALAGPDAISANRADRG